jgi:hypothetical protein
MEAITAALTQFLTETGAGKRHFAQCEVAA